jgi:hypothetical protein
MKLKSVRSGNSERLNTAVCFILYPVLFQLISGGKFWFAKLYMYICSGPLFHRCMIRYCYDNTALFRVTISRLNRLTLHVTKAKSQLHKMLTTCTNRIFLYIINKQCSGGQFTAFDTTSHIPLSSTNSDWSFITPSAGVGTSVYIFIHITFLFSSNSMKSLDRMPPVSCFSYIPLINF